MTAGFAIRRARPEDDAAVAVDHRPRVDVVMTLSGIFRDLLPLQTRLLRVLAE